MHMLMRGIINYSLIGEASIPHRFERTSTKLCKGSHVEIGHSLTLGALRHRTAIPEAALLKQSHSRVTPSC